MKAVAFVPSPPFLLPGLGATLPELKTACQQAVSVLTGLDVVVVGRAPRSGPWEGSVDATPWGAAGLPSQDPLPLALAVGRSLVDGRLHGAGSPVPHASGLLVVGDGTAKRSLKAPGHLDPRAEAYDAEVLSAVSSGDPARLLELDVALGEELWVDGLPAWRDAAAVAPGPWRAEVLYADAPYGVFYVVATWTR